MSKDQHPPTPPPSPYYSSSSTRFQQEQQEREQPPKKYSERDYEEIYYHFDDYSHDIILSNASKFMTPQEPAGHYEAEELILEEVSQGEIEGMKKSFLFGLGCGLVGFNMLRWRRGGAGAAGRGMMSKYASSLSTPVSSSSSRSSSGGYTFDPLPPPKSNVALNHQQYQHASGGGSSNNSNNNPRSGLLLDTLLGTIFGLGTSLLAMESDTFYPTTTNSSGDDIASPPPQWISPTIPLVPGRSILSETLCGPLTAEFRKFDKQLWQSGNARGIENGYNNHMALYANSGWKGTKYYSGNDNASVVSLGENGSGGSVASGEPQEGVYEHLVLDSLQGFIINCERRSRHEQRLRKIRGLRQGSTMPVVIPDDGVSAEDDLELDDIYFVGKGEWDRGDHGDNADAGFGL
mmetsp:Transcript_10604/g.23440  ORF Transcript_10604/g.23440 Transcript_10604/m.23440 type:complete len:405 (-) Transcript_10604:101-1315(-)